MHVPDAGFGAVVLLSLLCSGEDNTTVQGGAAGDFSPAVGVVLPARSRGFRCERGAPR